MSALRYFFLDKFKTECYIINSHVMRDKSRLFGGAPVSTVARNPVLRAGVKDP